MVFNANGRTSGSIPDRTGVDTNTDGASASTSPGRWPILPTALPVPQSPARSSPGQDDRIDPTAADMAYDVRGLWMMQMIGASSYTHRNPPNAQVGDALFVGMGAVFCVDRPGAPCDNTAGVVWDRYHAAARSNHPGGVNVAFGDGHGDASSATRSTWRCGSAWGR